MKKKIWLITGISSGLGKALALKVMQTGDFVIGTMRDRARITEFNERYEGNGKAFCLDVADLIKMQGVLDTVIKEFGKIDVLVNNAGIGFVGAVEEASLPEIRQVFEINFFASIQLTQAVLPIMREQRSGHIVQISSHGGVKAFAGFGVYNASKFALEGLSEAMAQELEPLGIKVSLIEPGPFRTNFAGKGLKEANTVIKDYAGTAGEFRSKLKGVDGKQEGDPLKAAEAIIAQVARVDHTLRLPLGVTALKTIGMKLDQLKSDLEINRDVATGTVY